VVRPVPSSKHVASDLFGDEREQSEAGVSVSAPSGGSCSRIDFTVATLREDHPRPTLNIDGPNRFVYAIESPLRGILHRRAYMEASLANSLEAIANLLYLIRLSLNEPGKALVYLDLADSVLLSIEAGSREHLPDERDDSA
jgi:hypothetical protein